MKKRVISLLLALVLALGLLPATARAADGTDISALPEFSEEADTSTAQEFKISSADSLEALATAVKNDDGNGAYNLKGLTFYLANDIELSGTWTPISNVTYPADAFAGTFDGNGHTISGLNITTQAPNQGLFGLINGATIQNLKVNGTVSCGKQNNIGGIVGKMQAGTISQCSFSGSVTGGYAGGIVGALNGTSVTIQNCSNTANINGTIAGGILGYWKKKATVENCYNTGKIVGSSKAAGIAGQLNNGAIKNCYNVGEISGNGDIGGIYAFCNGTVKKCYYLYPSKESLGTSNATKAEKIESTKGLADKLGDAFTTDDSGNVILKWEAGSTPAEKNPRIVISGGSTLQMTNSEQPRTTLTVAYKDMDETPTVTWRASNDCVTLETPNNATETNHTVIVHAVKPGTVKITAVAGEYTAEFTMSIVPRVSTVEIKNVKQPGAVAVGQTVQAKVNILDGGEYDYDNYPALTYQWYRYNVSTGKSEAISDATGQTYTIEKNEFDGKDQQYKIGVNVACNGETVHSYNDHQQYVRSAEYGKLYPVAYDEEFTLPSEIKEDTKLELPTERTKGDIKAGIKWSGFNDVIAADGTVTRPAAGKSTVKLTAKFTCGDAYANRTFEITVWSQAAVEAEANDKVLQLNNAIDAAKLNTLSPTYGKDTNVLTMVETKLNGSGITVSIDKVEKTNATDDSSAIAGDGTITYFYTDPNQAPAQRCGTYRVTFAFSRDGASVTREIPVVIYWNRGRVKEAMQKEILSKVNIDTSAQVAENFDLPKVVDGKKWAQISWQSSDPAITISTKKQTTADTLFDPYVAVVRGGSAEKKVTLTANFTFQLANSSDETSALTLHKTFTVNVAPSADGEKYQKALNAVFGEGSLTDAASGERLAAANGVFTVRNDIQFPTTRDLGAYMMARFGEGFDGKYTPVVITSSDTAVIAEPDVANAARVAVYRPAVRQGEETVTLTVKILDRPSGSGRDYANLPVLAEKTFRIVVKPLTQDEIDAEKALMAKVKAAYWDGIKNNNIVSEDVTGDLKPFVEVYEKDGALVWVRDVKEMRNSGIVPVAMDGWQELEAWRLFRSSNPAAVTHENLLVTQQFEGKAVTVTSALSSETLGRYGEMYKSDPVKYAAYKDLAELCDQSVSVDLVVRGRNRAHMKLRSFTVNNQTIERLVSEPRVEKVSVSFTLSGNGELWLGTRTLRDLDEGVTVFDVLRQLRKGGVLSFEHKGGYVESITCNGKTLAERDEGKNSGWLYTVNGELPDVYMSAYGLKNGDSIRIYFTKDYTKEPGADRWKPVTPVTKTETKPDGTIIETTTKPDGGTVVAETKPDGSVSTVEKRADGTEIKTAQPVSGEITASVSVPKSVGSTRVDIPVSKPSGSMVAVIVHPDGTEEIVRGSVVTETGVALRAEGDVRLKIIDNAKRFNDMANHWAKDAVEFASSRELFNGVGNDAFGPDRSMTRGMVSTVLARLAGADTAGGETWYAKGTVWAVENGISDGTAPEQPVTREQLAAMLYRYAGSPAVSGELGFDDADSISAWARDAVRWCVDNGILNGVGGNRMTPQDLARRGQVAAMLMRFLQATV